MEKLVRFVVKSGTMWNHYFHKDSFYTTDITHEGILERIHKECIYCDNPVLVSYEVVEFSWKAK